MALLGILAKGYASNKQQFLDGVFASGSVDNETLGRIKAQNELIEDLKNANEEEWNQWNDKFES